jgi:outer membrane protein
MSRGPVFPNRFSCAVLALAAAAFAGAAEAQSLSEAYVGALRSDPEFAGAIADRDGALENEGLARALFRPRIVLSGNAGYSDVQSDGQRTASPSLSVPSDTRGSSGAVVVGLEQPIIDGAARAQGRQLLAGARAGDHAYEAQRQALAVRVVKAYFDVLRREAQLTALRSQQAAADLERRAAQARFDAGRARITDVREAQARADAAAAQIIGSEAQRELAVSTFRELTGLEAADLMPPGPGFAPQPPGNSLGVWLRQAELHAPSALARQEQLTASLAATDRYGWAEQIKVTAQVSAGQVWRGGSASLMGGFYSPPDSASGFVAGVKLQMPLYTGGSLDAQRRQAAADARNSRAELETTLRDIRLQVEQAWRAQDSGARQVAALRIALASAQLQQQAAVTGLEVGMRTQSDVLAAQAQVFDVQRQLAEAIYDYGESLFGLSAAAGELTTERFAEIERTLLVNSPEAVPVAR